MKRLISWAAALSLSLYFATPVVAQSNGGSARENVEFCKDFVGSGDEPPGLNRGECISVGQTPDPVDFCKFLKAIGVLDAEGLTLGQCIVLSRQ